jgi:hypothetical protein
VSSGGFATVVMIMAARGNTKHKSSVAMAMDARELGRERSMFLWGRFVRFRR